MSEKETHLVVIGDRKVSEVFKNAASVKALLAEIEARAADFTPDLSTQASRKRLNSHAFMVTRSKTLFDKWGQDKISGIQAEIKAWNACRKLLRDGCDEIAARTRAPLTEWEKADKERIALAQATIRWFKIRASAESEGRALTVNQLETRLQATKAEAVSPDLAEFLEEAAIEKGKTITFLENTLKDRIKYEAEQEELRAHRKKEREREAEAEVQRQKERDEKLKQEAVERALKEVEEKAEKARVEALRAEQFKIVQAQAKRDQEAAAERARVEAAHKAELAEKQAKLDAKENERLEKERLDRIEAERERKRQANKANRKNVHEAIESALASILLDTIGHPDRSMMASKAIVNAMAKGNIPHVQINY